MTLFLVLPLILTGCLLVIGWFVKAGSASGAASDAFQDKTPAAFEELGATGALHPGYDLHHGERNYRLTGREYVQRGQTAAGGTAASVLCLDTPLREVRRPAGGTAFRDKPEEASLGTLPDVILRREIATDKRGKRLRLNHELQTGDADFDAAIYIEHAGDAAGVDELLAHEEVRLAVLETVDESTSVAFNHQGHALALRWDRQRAPTD